MSSGIDALKLVTIYQFVPHIFYRFNLDQYHC